MKRRAARLMALSLLALGLPLGAVSGEEAVTGFEGFDLLARAEGIDILYTSVDGTSGQGSVPEAAASMSTGPVGEGLASLAWPGPTVADVGTLITFLGGGEEAKRLNYPLRAQAFAPQGPVYSENEVPPATSMRAHAGPVRTEAAAHSASSDVGGLFSAGTMTSAARTAADPAEVISDSISHVEDFSLLGGTVTIKKVESRARSTSDGTLGTTSARTTFSGVQIAGRPAVIDEGGVRFEDQATDAAGAAAEQLAERALAASGIKIHVLRPQEERNGADATVTAGSVVFSVNGEGHFLTLALGGATARSSARLSDAGFLDDLLGTSGEGDPLPALDEGAEAGATAAPLVEPGDAADPAPPALLPRPVEDHRSEMINPSARFSGGIAPAVVLVALAVAMLAALTLRRVCDGAFAAAILPCGPGGDHDPRR